MMRITHGLAAAAFVSLSVSAPENALAQTQNAQCAPRQAFIDALQSNYSESRRGIGLAQTGAVVEVWASDETGTWSVTATLPSGITCLIASGGNWSTLAGALPPEGDPA